MIYSLGNCRTLKWKQRNRIYKASESMNTNSKGYNTWINDDSWDTQLALDNNTVIVINSMSTIILMINLNIYMVLF